MPWNYLDTRLTKAQDTVVTYKEQQLFWNGMVFLLRDCFVMLGIKPRTLSMPTTSLYLSTTLCPCVLSYSGESLFEITVVEGWVCHGREAQQQGWRTGRSRKLSIHILNHKHKAKMVNWMWWSGAFYSQNLLPVTHLLSNSTSPELPPNKATNWVK